MPFSGHTLELYVTSVSEGQPGTGNQVLDGARNDNLVPLAALPEPGEERLDLSDYLRGIDPPSMIDALQLDEASPGASPYARATRRTRSAQTSDSRLIRMKNAQYVTESAGSRA